jgi:hypothetical protein
MQACKRPSWGCFEHCKMLELLNTTTFWHASVHPTWGMTCHPDARTTEAAHGRARTTALACRAGIPQGSMFEFRIAQ